MLALLFQGWGWIECSMDTVSDGSLSFQGWGMAIELAANIVDNPRCRVGLAATIVDLAVGLAASIW